MIYIRHRINTLAGLNDVAPEFGVELDLRYEGNRLVLHHDPFSAGEDFEDYLKNYRHGLMIVNVKSEGIEDRARELLKQYDVRDYFFLDLSFPALIRLAKTGERNIAVRYSEYEPVEQTLALRGLVKWVWVDCFTKCPLNPESYSILKKHFQICLVSPELQKHPPEQIEVLKKQLAGFEIDAVCTKVPHLWKK